MHSSPLSRRGLRLVTVAVACLAVGLATLPADAVHPTHSRIVSADPVDWTPHVLDGQVNAVVQVGNIAVVGGTFTQVRAQGSTTTLTRNYLFALDTTTGAIIPGFAPALNNTVESIVVAPGGTAVIVGGSFTAVNGANRRRLARINLGTGQLETGFVANTNSLVEDLVLRNGWLYASGKFTTVKGVARSGVARLDPVTGSVDPQLNLAFTDPPRSTMNVQEIEVSPAGTQLVAVGNFGRVAGVSRIQIAMLDLTTTPVSLANWQTDEFPVFNPAAPTATWCSSTFPSYMRGVDFSPDGSYFVVITTGANRPERMCDTASRWESSARGAGLKPSWVNWTGGDTLTAVAITGAAIYVGGHQQYMNNPYIAQGCGVCPGPGPGGIPRQGLAALDPVNGLPFSWDPGRARGYGVNSFFGTAEGLWLGSDTDTLGGETHRKLGFFPLGVEVPGNDPYPITADLYNLSQATGQMLRRPYNPAGPGAGTPVDVGVDWRQARGAFALNGRLYTGWNDGTLTVRTFDGTAVGPASTIDLHGLQVAPPTVFKIPGTKTAIPSFATHLASMTGMFFHRGRIYYTVSGDTRLYYRYFTPESQIVGANLFVASTGDGVMWSKVRGMTMSSGQLVYATSEGKLWRVAFDERPVGSSTQIGGQGKDGLDWTSTGLFSFVP